MKKLLFAVLLIGSFSTTAQTVQLDTPSNIAYAEIEPVAINWLKGSPSVTRVYVSIVNFNLVNNTFFNYWLKYPVVIDSNTVNYTTIMSGSLSLPVNTSVSIDDARNYIFNYVADSIQFNVIYK